MKQNITVNQIPAVLWGETSNRLFIAIHGNKSHKEDDVIAAFAECAIVKSSSVLSFDLPGHGERKNEHNSCLFLDAVQDLGTMMRYAKEKADDIRVFACSMGAYFSLCALKDEPLSQALFLSPVLNMERLIQNMMTWFHISEEKLKAEKEIPTPIGQTMYWDDYCYVKEHPLTTWNVPTAILYGTKDDIVERETVETFSARFNAQFDVLENGEHYFHSEEDLSFFKKWCENVMPISKLSS